MFRELPEGPQKRKTCEAIASFFNAEITSGQAQLHVHGQRIDADRLRGLGVKVESLETDQKFQDDVLTAYHLMTLIFETTASLKFIATDAGKMWAKQQQQILVPAPQPVKNLRGSRKRN